MEAMVGIGAVMAIGPGSLPNYQNKLNLSSIYIFVISHAARLD